MHLPLAKQQQPTVAFWVGPPSFRLENAIGLRIRTLELADSLRLLVAIH